MGRPKTEIIAFRLSGFPAYSSIVISISAPKGQARFPKMYKSFEWLKRVRVPGEEKEPTVETVEGQISISLRYVIVGIQRRSP